MIVSNWIYTIDAIASISSEYFLIIHVKISSQICQRRSQKILAGYKGGARSNHIYSRSASILGGAYLQAGRGDKTAFYDAKLKLIFLRKTCGKSGLFQTKDSIFIRFSTLHIFHESRIKTEGGDVCMSLVRTESKKRNRRW